MYSGVNENIIEIHDPPTAGDQGEHKRGNEGVVVCTWGMVGD